MKGLCEAGCDPVRHDLLYLTGDGWAALMARDPALAGITGLRHWAAHHLPIMRRRRQLGDQPGLVPVAVALPAAQGRARLAFQVAPEEIAIIRQPPALGEAASGLPQFLRLRAEAVLTLAAGLGLAPCLFGSAMWQHVTGLSYLHARSDLDLLWNIPNGRKPAIGRLVAALRAIEAAPGPRLDGEIVLDRAWAVNWRELAGEGATELLVKTGENVVLMTRDRFLQEEMVPC